MANIRELKKDVNFLTSEVVSQAFFNQYLYPEIPENVLHEIIAKAINLRNETIRAINIKDDKETRKIRLRKIRESFVKSVFSLLEELKDIKK